MITISVYDLMDLFLEQDFQRVRLYDLSANAGEQVIFDGFLRDMPLEYGNLEIMSIDNLTNKTLALNVDTTEG